MAVSSDEINYLIYRYLQESGFTHSAFTFAHESLVYKSNIAGEKVQPGALVSFLQRGLQYLEIESHLNDDGTTKQCTAAFSLVEPHACQAAKSRSDDMDHDAGPAVPVIPANDARKLVGHQSEVFCCEWSPNGQYLASGSGDKTARIWTIPDTRTAEAKCVVLDHRTSDSQCDVTTLDWNNDGSLLATGCYDGIARVWTTSGQLRAQLDLHKGPIFSLRWNQRGDYLLSGSLDKRVIVWDVASAQAKQVFEFHTAPALDVDWRSNNSFASCGTDRMIYVCSLGESRPTRTFQGHTDEVNTVKWDPTGLFLASCSDDYTAKIWSFASGRMVYDLKEHTREIYTIRWSPTGPNTANASLPLLLATASFDATVKLWNAETGECVHTLREHKEPIYSISFSPNGELLATGSFDQQLHIWNVKDGKLVRTYNAGAGIFEVVWNNRGDRLSIASSDSTLTVLDVRM